VIVDNTIQITVTKFYDLYTLTSLKQLYDKLNEYIGQNKLSQDLFSQHVNAANTKIQEIIQNNIFIANGDNSNPIPANNILGFKFINNQLEITLKSDYTKFVTTSTYDNVVLENDKLIVKNFSYYQIIQIDVDKLDSLKQNIQSLITTNQWTQTDFNNQLSIETFKTSVAGYLGISSSYIDTMTFTDGNLNISSEVNKKFESTQPTTIINSDDVIVVNGFQFYALDTLSNFDALYKAINKFIADNKLTVSDFASQVSTNNNTIKKLIIDNLQVNNVAIESSWINNVSFVNNDTTQQLEVTLNNYFVKYNGTSTNTVQIENNKLIIKNLEYFNLITIDSTNLNGLKDNIQQFIRNSSEQFTSEQFLAQINSNTFKGKIATYLGIDVNAIGNIEFNNNTLTISPNSMYKFKSSTDNALIDDNGIIYVSNFTFFNLYDIVNLNNLFTGINAYIAQTNNQYTEDQFANDVSTNPDSIKTVIASNLQLQLGDTTQNVTVENIKIVTYNNIEHQLEITLSDNYFKYQQTTQDNNISLNGDKVIVRNLEFFNEISFNSADLDALRTNIQNLINENQVNSNNISSYLSKQIYDLVKNINTVNNGNLEQYIVEPTYSNDSINISLKLDVGLYKFKTTSLTDISITSNSISLNSITLYAPPTPSPATWFTWDGTRITGLSDLGREQTRFVLPEFTTEISDSSFSSNKTIEYIDASLSKLTKIGNSSFRRSSISKFIFPNTLTTLGDYCFNGANIQNVDLSNTKVKIIPYMSFSPIKFEDNAVYTVSLPETVTSIESYAFADSSISHIELPDSITIINTYSFLRCRNLSSIKLPKNLSNIGESVFQSSNISTIDLSVTKLKNIATSTFYNCINLTSIKLGDDITYLGDNAFRGCTSLETINLPNNISTMGTYVFNSCTKLKSLVIPNQVKVINDFAFTNCSALSSIILPINLTTIGTYAFAGCINLNELTIPNGLTSVGQYAFNKDTSSNSIILNNLVIFVNSNSVESLIKSIFSGTVINLSKN
ncbi:MAG: leucine-rich repeat domain-containing protein, partial [Ureaplasma sp.]|nr:leucine-rich repeat domain-containing protein [Ureaplasma sp.]